MQGINDDIQASPALKSYLFIPSLLPDKIKSEDKQEDIVKLEANIEAKPNQVIQKADVDIAEKIESGKSIKQSEFNVSSVLIDASSFADSTLNKIPSKPIVITSESDSSKPIVVSSSDQKLGKLVKRHLKNYHTSYSQQQAQEYRTLQTSPVIDTVNALNTTSIDLKRPVVKVDCNNTGIQVLATISGLMNGTVKCGSNNNFQFYIDQRLHPLQEKVTQPTIITNKATLKPLNYSEEASSEIDN